MAQAGFFRWLVLLICVFICQNIDSSFNWLNTENLSHLNATRTEYRIFFNTNNLVGLISGPLTYGLTRCFETRTVTVAALAVSLVSFTAAPFLKSFYFYLILQGIIAKVATGCAVIGCLFTIGAHFNKQLPFAASVFYLGRGLVSVLIAFLLPTHRFLWLGKLVYTICALATSCLLAVCLKPPSNDSSQQTIKEPDQGVNETLLFTNNNNNEPKPSCAARSFRGVLRFLVLFANWKLLLVALMQACIVAGNVTALSFISMQAASIYSVEPLPKPSSLTIALIVICSVTLPLTFLLSVLIYKKLISAININTVMVLVTLGVTVGGHFCHDPTALIVYSIFLIIRSIELDTLCLTYIQELLGRDKFDSAVAIVEMLKTAGNIVANQFVWYGHMGAVEEEGRSEYVSENPLKQLRKTLFIFSAVSYGLAFTFSAVVSLVTKIIAIKAPR